MKREVQQLIDLLQDAKFEKAADLLRGLGLSENDAKLIVYLCSDPENGVGVAAYTFTLHLLLKQGGVEWHETARDILSNNLCHLRGAYQASLYHAEAVCKQRPSDINAWELYLDIGANRSRVHSREKVDTICNVLLGLDPSNVKASTYKSRSESL